MTKSKVVSYAMLGVAIAVEVFAATAMKLSEGFTNIPWSVAAVVTFGVSFFLLSKVLLVLPLGLTYGLWGGVGVIATAIIGLVVWGDPLSAVTVVAMAMVILGIAVLARGFSQDEAR